MIFFFLVYRKNKIWFPLFDVVVLTVKECRFAVLGGDFGKDLWICSCSSKDLSNHVACTVCVGGWILGSPAIWSNKCFFCGLLGPWKEEKGPL